MKLLAIVTLAVAAGSAPAATLIGSAFEQPVFLASTASDSRLFVVEKTGRVKVLGSSDPTAWLDLSTQVNTDGERGLLGLAFDPNFSTNQRIYVDYIDKTTLATVVASYTLGANGKPDTSTAKTIISIDQVGGFSNHKAGWIGFSSADPGNLYIATGDGGSANDPNGNAQNLNSNLGKLLRITPNAAGSYTVPTDNPFVGVAGNDEIWAYGLRNPYRNSFDRATGDLWIADVGQGAREEVDFAAAASGLGRGANYGWRLREGTIATPGVGGAKPADNVDPLYDYGRDLGGSIIGGYVYRGGADASLQGKYIFGDYLSGSIWALSGGTATALVSPFGPGELTSFGEGSDGALYALGINGSVYLLAAAVPEPAPAALLAVGLMAYSLIRRRRA
ncbi:PQQ-dependent sugar dehydrogenase [Roseateles sp.]|uniref:PQQ-dependent sugar dehydrogenase n=1 Tax=Roseateles sp. TaxID=1971397 RepID=UPI003266A69D